MTDWLNSNLGSDTATYLGLFLGIIALFIGGSKYKKWRKSSIKQNAKSIQGDVNQGGRDVNQSGRDINQSGRDINHYYYANDSENNQSKNKYEHDLKIIEQILEILPYEDTLRWVEQSSINGLPNEICLNMEKAEKFSGENYRLFNAEVNNAKNAFIEAMRLFIDSTMSFLHIDYPDRVPVMLSLPHDWKYKSEKSENTFRICQKNLRETSGEMIECYKKFVITIKNQEFITDRF